MRPVTDVGLPSWWHPLADAAARIEARDISRFAVPPSRARVRASAVLILIGEGEHGPDVVLLQRAATLRDHAGQPGFPGGAVEAGDIGPADTALREAGEEIGLRPTSVVVVTTLPELWISVTNFAVTPVLAWWRTPHPIAAVDAAEVAEVFRVPVATLSNPANRVRAHHPSGYTGPAFQVAGTLVWGFTAGVLNSVLDLAGWSRPWDPATVVSVD